MPIDPRILCAAGQPDEEGQSGGEPTDAAPQVPQAGDVAPQAEGEMAPADGAEQSASDSATMPEDEPSPEQALQDAEQAVESLRVEAGLTDGESTVERGEATDVDLPEFSAATPADASNGIELLSKVNLNVRIELGRTKMLVEDVLRLNEGSVVELDKLAGDPVDIYVNDRHVACGEVLVLNDTFCVRISEIFSRHPGGSGRRNGAPRPRAA